MLFGRIFIVCVVGIGVPLTRALMYALFFVSSVVLQIVYKEKKMSTKKCPQCAETVGADAVKCEFCGAELSTQEKSAVQDKLNRGKKTIGSLVNNLTSFENKGMFDPKIALLLSVEVISK
ncbi:MAG: hypothetical protein E7038_09670 [Lentisphaerae bacterium]|nr:hypothetical protein [Lentisphaerota bacterium]